MAYFADLTPYTYFEERSPGNVVNVGWLDRAHEFSRGPVPDEVLAKLFSLCKHPVHQTRGFHVCELCPDAKVGQFAERGGVRIGIASAEIRVPGPDGLVYACPMLIYHYIKDHGYQPPVAFVRALDLLEI